MHLEVSDMALTKIKIGKLITEYNVRNTEDKAFPFFGINIDKEFMPSVASTDSVDKSKYKIVKKGVFVFSGMQTGRDCCIRIGMYEKDDIVLVSPAYTTFTVTSPLVLPEYFFMYFRSSEKDRYGAFLSDGSIRSNLDWNVFCDIELELPSIEIQRKYVAIYKGMVDNQIAYETGLEDLKLVCDSFVENLKKTTKTKPIGQFIIELNERNDGTVTLAQGVDVNLQFIPAKREAEDKESGKIVHDGEFAFNKVVKCNGTKLPIALRKGPTCFISGSYTVFKVTDQTKLIPEYLMLWMSREETQRKCGFNAWGSTRDVLPFEELCQLQIPYPKITVQQAIVDIYNAYIMRKEINEQLKQQIKNICPVLIKGAVEEAKRS